MLTRVHVYTFREGLLARLAHDLRLTAGAFELQLENGQLRGWFDASSWTVDGVARGERIDAQGLSSDDKRKIADTIARELLDAARYPRIELEGRVLREAGALAAEVRVQLRGRERTFRVPLRIEPSRTIAEVEFAPSQFGIAPYKALGGAIRLQDRVRVRVEVVAEPDKVDAVSASPQATVFHPG